MALIGENSYVEAYQCLIMLCYRIVGIDGTLLRSIVYNYLGRLQPFEDEAFIEELQTWLEIFHKLYSIPFSFNSF